MPPWQIMEWDLATPLIEELKPRLRRAELHTIALDNIPMDGAITLKTLGEVVQAQLPQGVPVRANRRDAKFIWADVRISIDSGNDSLDSQFLEQVRRDPLLHQRLFDAVQTEFRKACAASAEAILQYESKLLWERSRRSPPFPPQKTDALTLKLVQDVQSEISSARSRAITELLKILKETLPRELAGKRTSSDKLKARVMIGLGVAGVICSAVGAAAAIVATGGVAGAIFAGVGIYAGSRGLLDTLKALGDEFIGVERLRKRIVGAITVFRDSKTLNGTKRTVEALANSMLKAGAIGYNLVGSPRFASLSDLGESLKLYEEKLCTIRAKSHELSRHVGKILNEMDKHGGAGTPQAQLELHNLLMKIPELHTKCNNDLAKLPDLKAAVQQVIQSQGRNFVLLEKWFDLSINVFLTGLGTFDSLCGYIAGAKTALEIAGGVTAGVSTVIDVASETVQAESNASSRYERG